MNNLNNLYRQALAYHQAGRIAEAINLYRQVLPKHRDNDELLFAIGTACCQIGQLEEGLGFLRKSARINPKNFHVHSNMGRLLSDLRRFDEAILNYNKAISLNPRFPEAFLGRGNAFVEKKKYEESLKDFEKALELVPNFAIAHLNKGKALFELKKFDEALDCFNKTIYLSPNIAEAYINRGNVFKELGQYDQALLDYSRAIQINPNIEGAYSNRGCVLKKLKRYEEALDDLGIAIGLKSDYAEAYGNRGAVLQELMKFDEALVNYDKAIALRFDIDYLLGAKLHAQMHLCDWSDFENQVQSLVDNIELQKKVTDPFVLLSLVDAPDVHKAAAEIYVSDMNAKYEQSIGFKIAKNNKKIKIGYFSADFHGHATMHLMAELFEKHNKDKFELVAFSFGPTTNDKWQTRVKNAFDKFIDCSGLTDTEVAELSRKLGVDISVDLKGFTQDARAKVFAERAAPIQVSFLGYPGTLSAKYIDYLIADKIVIPEENHLFYTEKIAYLHDCYQPNCREREISRKPISRSDFGLPETGIVFGSFNDNYKITPYVFESWMRILKSVKGSVLWVLASNATAESNLLCEAERHEVDPTRLIFAKKIPVEEHLSRLQLADLMLDTFPYGAHTTCSDALRVGLPVVTMAGKSFASRVAASLLTTMGCPDLITNSYAAYEDLVIHLSKNPDELSEIRTRIKCCVKDSALYDSTLFTRHLEILYQAMYDKYLEDLPADCVKAK